MSNTGIICEYNPFHKGHEKLIAMHKEKNPQAKIIAIMSGNITQRGEFPLLDKWTRAKLAVQQGVDLVIELPTVFALNSAQYFAQGGVQLLQSLGIVQEMICGCEHQDLARVKFLAQQLLNPQLSPLIRANLNQGLSYPQALSQALTKLSTGDNNSVHNFEEILNNPNSVLALAYQQALLQIQSPISLTLYQRIGSNHNDNKASQGFASGTAIRQWVQNRENLDLIQAVLPPYSYELISQLDSRSYPQSMWIFNILVYKIITMKENQLREIQNIREGLEFKIYQAVKNSSSLEELIAQVKSKRYTYTNIQRTLMYLLLDINKEMMAEALHQGPQYARILAFNQQGQKLLAEIRDQATIPLITKVSKYLNPKTPFQKTHLTPLENMLAMDVKATNLFYLACNQPQNLHKDFTTGPVIVDN